MQIFDNLGNSYITICFAIISILMAVLLYFQVITSDQLYFDKYFIFQKSEYWRLLTSIFFTGSFNTQSLIAIGQMIICSSQIESAFFSHRPADYLLFNLFGWASLWIYAYFSSSPFLQYCFSDYLLYYFVKLSPEDFIIFLIPMKNKLFIIVYTLFNLRRFKAYFTSVAAAHFYFFIKNVINLRFNKNFLVFPEWINQKILKIVS
ncbi:Derlin-2/3 [Tritrichomonas foetus]|uniref:Derlin n=1 Tax=Tritrichomonas foetus TaxID=1144522 RepID=A0A1J4J1B5_9EUKA|nr:Derlin-2/3 [Tritrichomonas foetus]|eukprot:OHS93336.1 Derlin-2/3 [Tritrichomonas foetus]